MWSGGIGYADLATRQPATPDTLYQVDAVSRTVTALAMLLAAQARGWELYYMEQDDLFLRDSDCHAQMCRLEVRADPQDWFTRAEPETRLLASLDVVLMRKDPPVDMEYLYTTFLLQRAEAAGVLVVNRPALRHGTALHPGDHCR